jgi:protein O-mannosyl-transferase
MRRESSFHWAGILALVVAAATIMVYLPALRNDFTYDSRSQVLVDDTIHNPANIPRVLSLRVLADDVLDHNRPLVLLSLMLDSLLWGKLAAGYALTNLLLHVACVVLLLALLRSLMGRAFPGAAPPLVACAAAVGALWFAVHPVNVEAVCVVSYREDLLATFFLLAALCLADRLPHPRPAIQALLYAAVSLCALLSIASKESGVAVPVCLAAYARFFRWAPGDPVPRRTWVLLAGVAGCFTAAFLAARFRLDPIRSVIYMCAPIYPGGSFGAMLQIQPRILAFYLQITLVPVGLCADYGIRCMQHIGLTAALVILAATSLAIAWGCWRSRMIRLATAIALAGLLPVMNLVPIYIAAADRFLYMPLIGAALVLALAAYRLLSAQGYRWIARGCFALLLLACVMNARLAVRRERIWQDELTLWTETFQCNPLSRTAANNLGYALYEARRYEDAVRIFTGAVRLSQERHADSLAGLALGFDAVGRLPEARQALAKAVKIDPDIIQPDRLARRLQTEPHLALRIRATAIRTGLIPPEQQP